MKSINSNLSLSCEGLNYYLYKRVRVNWHQVSPRWVREWRSVGGQKISARNQILEGKVENCPEHVREISPFNAAMWLKFKSYWLRLVITRRLKTQVALDKLLCWLMTEDDTRPSAAPWLGARWSRLEPAKLLMCSDATKHQIAVELFPSRRVRLCLHQIWTLLCPHASD